MPDFSKVIIFDGAMGTMLQKKGLKLGEIPEELNITHPEIIKEIHSAYIDAGADFITTNTFGANEKKIARSEYSVEELITAGVKNAKEAAAGKAGVALDIGPIGELLEPLGSLPFDEAYEIFKKQIVCGVKAGSDLILIETMTDLYEMKAAVLAAKENSNLPVFATMSFEETGRTFTGCTVKSMVAVLSGLGVDAIGVNCSLGPVQLKGIVEEILSSTNVPVMVQPNAGLPKVVDGVTVFDITKEEFAKCVNEFADMGISVAGGCCGTTPEYIKEVAKTLKGADVKPHNYANSSKVCTPSVYVEIDGVKVIGERINPTGKKIFKQALIDNNIAYIIEQGFAQVDAGADILDVNVGLPEINEPEMMKNVIKELQTVISVPLQIDSSDPEAVKQGLRYYNGKPLVNSVNGEDAVLDNILPLVKKYGAAVVGLTLSEKGIPKKAEERFEIAEKIVKRAMEYGIAKEDIYIDCLTLTASAQQEDVYETLKGVSMVKERLGVKTILGVSNISFGLPNRELINTTFLTMAMHSGLDLPIINPNSEAMMNAVAAFKVLNNTDANANNYIEKFSADTKAPAPAVSEEKQDLQTIVVKGLKEAAKTATEELLKTEKELDIVNNHLIPALDVVGELYEKGKLFLPQLIQSAETVKVAFEVLKARMQNENSISKGTIILATVKGDVHDIGKNIVKVILENYGYTVLDLGKDVSSQAIVDCIKENNVKLVGLSALMTTTLKSMEDAIKHIHSEKLDCKIIVGGAVLTPDYAKTIGADYYAKDAKETAEIAKRFFD
ncbi:MAG: homocysteine S-methyltransferase family protein [Clostridia bacterium]|nr:homocysteine S-methyltransferase family protein [Clostridia bacterium]